MLGSMELAFLLFFGAGSQTNDVVSLIPPRDYFQHKAMQTSPAKLVDLACAEPKTADVQLAQLLAMRLLMEETGKWKDDAGYQKQRRQVEAVAAGQKAQDPQGFAQVYAQRLLALVDGKDPPPRPAAPKLKVDAFAWFPAEANILGALDARLAIGPPLFKVGYESEVFKRIPKRNRKEMYDILEQLGNVRIDRVAFAMVETPMDSKNELYLRVTGKFNRAWVMNALQKVGIQFQDAKGPGGLPMSIGIGNGPKEATPLALIGDQDLLICGTPESASQTLLDKALAIADKKNPNAAQGKLKDDLARISDKATGLAVAQLSPNTQGLLKLFLGGELEKVSGTLVRSPAGLDLQLELGLGDEKQATTVVGKIGEFRKMGLDALGNLPPIPDFPIAQVKALLESWQVEGQGKTVKTGVLIADELLRRIPPLLLNLVPAADVDADPAPPPPKNEQGKRRAA